ncbi:hypothetical protein DLI08_24175 [Vibrio parahaemolyticus]|nr:hypothetical protein [Vibrio parahaemolyticus]EGX6076637.1 hypothetical protein [Vibrio parahaemolyticus]EKG9566022.1 hypothetical protein [Vibrio parahaemolyticus]EKG9666027.1 hypothetical protein [Vibrio parahaemolyticus]EKG9671173.1 hypothetical protein [Vibrio parahaemolyticus]
MEIVKAYKEKVSSLTNEEAAYLIGFISFLAMPLINYFAPFPSYWIFLGFVLSGAIIWLNGIAKQASSLLFVKAFWGVVIIAGTALNLGLASTNVNSILEVPSSPFAYTITVASVMLIPITLSIIGLFLALPLVPIAMFSSVSQLDDFAPKKLLTLSFLKNFGRKSPVLLFGRIVACICLLSTCIAFNKDTSWYLDVVDEKIKWFAYHLETEEFSYCKLGENERVAYLPNGKVVIASKSLDSYNFRVSLCESAL